MNLAVQTFSLIDNILVNHLENFRAGLLSSDVSNHIPIFLIYEFILSINTSIAHRIRNPLRRTSEHIAIIYFQIFTAFCLFLNLKEYDMYLSYHTYSYIDYITMHFLNKFSLDNDLILVHRKLCHKLITLEDFINLHNM